MEAGLGTIRCRAEKRDDSIDYAALFPSSHPRRISDLGRDGDALSEQREEEEEDEMP